MERRTVKSSMRTFEVLELFRKQRRPLKLQEIHEALEMPQSSATTLLKSMTLAGYLNYDRSARTYLPTTKVSALGSWLPGFIHQDHRVCGLIHEMQLQTDETVSLVGQNDLFVQYLIVRQPKHEHKAPPPSGYLRMMVDSIAGIALMSAMSDREIEKLYRLSTYYELDKREDFYPMSDGPHGALADIMAEIRWVRQVGYSYRTGHPTPDLAGIAMSLQASAQGVPLAIGVGGLRDRIEPRKAHILKTMRDLIAQYQFEELAFAPQGNSHERCRLT